MTSPSSKYNWRSFDNEPPQGVQPYQGEFKAMKSESAEAIDFEPMILATNAAVATPSFNEIDLALEFQKGRDDAMKAMDAERELFTDRIESLGLKNMALSKKLAESSDLANRIAKDVLGHLLRDARNGALNVDPDAWRQALDAIMRAAELKGPLLIKANPGQMKQIEASLEDKLDFPQASFQADADIPIGEIHVGDGTTNWMATMDELLNTLGHLLIVSGRPASP